MSKKDKTFREPLAIIGMACRFPKADNIEEYWANILNGTDCIEEIPETHWRTEDYFNDDPKTPDHTYAKRGGFLSKTDFHPMEFGIPPKSIEATDTSQLLGMMVAKEALRDAGYGDGKTFDRSKTSVILGVTGALELVIPLGARLGHPIWRRVLKEAGIESELAEEIVRKIADGYVPWQEQSFPGLLGNVVAGRIANYLDLGGTNCVADAACASAMSALHLASMELWSGKADMVLTGGIDTFSDIFMYMCFSKTPALSPTGNARPFAEDGDGTILGEGLGILVLKRLSDAQRQGDRIVAVLRGMGTSSDGKGNAIYAPSSKGQMAALERAYRAAGVAPTSVELVEGHGTGTKAGDSAELRALFEVYSKAGARGRGAAIGSVKSQIGHTKAAAGAAGLIKAALALKHGVLPPSIKVDKPLSLLCNEQSPFYLNDQSRPWITEDGQPRRAGVSAFGFGGSNFHCVLEEADRSGEQISWDSRVHMVAFSGSEGSAIRRALSGLDSGQSWQSLTTFALASLANFNVDDPCRLVLVVEQNRTDLARLKAHGMALLEKYGTDSDWHSPEGIYFGCGPKKGKLGLLFPGQGSQYTGMLRDLACRFPQVCNILEEVDQVFAEAEDFGDGDKLSDYIYPKPSIDPNVGKTNEARLRQTQNAQPAIGAVSIGALKVLNHFGVEPEAAAGHSYGEITALCASKRFGTQALSMLSRLRGKLMAEGDGDRGAMLAVRAPVTSVAALIAENQLDLVMANKNAPEQVVLSGASSEIDRATGILQENKVSNKRLPVAAAFHSTLVAQASQPFSAELQKIDFPAATIPVYSNTTAQPYPENAEKAKELLATHLTQPVEFVDEIENMYSDGVRTFLEVGPGARLTGLVKSILDGKPFNALAVDGSSGKRSGTFDLAKVLGQLAALGYPVSLDRWERRPEQTPVAAKKGPAITLSGANYVDPATRSRAEKPMTRTASAPPMPAVVEASVQPAPGRPNPSLSQVGKPSPTAPQKPTSQSRPLPVFPQAAFAGNLQQAFEATQRNMAVLEKMQEETSKLHLKFLESQEAAQQSLMQLMQQQNGLFQGGASETAATFTQPQPLAAPVETEIPVAETRPSTEALSAADPGRVSEEPAQKPPSLDADLSLRLERTLKQVVSEKTGYPEALLEMPMALDGDLGIDSIKRVEIFSALGEHLPGLPELKPDQLGELQTLADIVQHLQNGMDAATGATAQKPPVPPAQMNLPVQETLMNIVAEKTGYPQEMLEPAMSLDGDLGIDSIKRVEILSALSEALPGLPELAPDQLGALQTLGEIASALSGAVEAPPVAELPAAISQQKLFELVAEKTGYPADMLEPDMQLDSDLGIDSIKRVEILSALSEAYPQFPQLTPDQVGGLASLGDIVAMMSDQLQTGSAQPTLEPAFQSQVASGSGLTDSQLAEDLKRVVAEKTGYPAEMLEMTMGLESDLGIDSIKRVEILSALQETLPQLPEISPDRLGQVETLAEVVALYQQPRLKETPSVAFGKAPESETPEQAPDVVKQWSIQVTPLVENRDFVELKGRNLYLVHDDSDWADAVKTAFEEAGLQVHSLDVDNHADWESLEDPAGLVILAPQDQTADGFLKQSLFGVQKASPSLRSAGKESGALFATVSRLDGCFGFENLSPARSPRFGGLAGLAKTAAMEWSEVTCKALDVAPEGPLEELAQGTVREVLLQGPAEVGITASGPRGLELLEHNPSQAAGEPLSEGDIVLVTGGAKGVTASTCVALARAFKPHLVLLGRSALSQDNEPVWLAGLTSESEIKKALFEKGDGPKTPAEIGKQCRFILDQREMKTHMDAMRAAGATVTYRSADLRNPPALAAILAEIKAELGPVKGLVHGAGVLADRLIEDKTEAQFDLVFETKVGGLEELLQHLAKDPLKVMALFSSSTARYGRTGQVDYAMANEVLNKMAQQQAKLRPDCRVVSMNWGPWDGGMVTPQLKKLFASEGIGLIPLDRGADLLVTALAENSGPVERVVLGEREEKKNTAESEPVFSPEAEPVADELHLAFELKLDPSSHAFLKSHVLNGKMVLPVVMTMEWLIHGALHEFVGMRYHGLDHLRVLKGVTLNADETVDLGFYVGKGQSEQGRTRVTVEMRSKQGDQFLRHCRADVVLVSGGLPSAAPRLALPQTGGENLSVREDRFYDLLFHGSHFQGLLAMNQFDANGFVGQLALADSPGAWMNKPLRRSWYGDPLVLDSAFQAMVLWTHRFLNAPSLPVSLGQWRQFQAFPPGQQEIQLVVSIVEKTAHKAIANMEFLDADGNLIAQLNGYECVVDASLTEAFARNELPSQVLEA